MQPFIRLSHCPFSYSSVHQISLVLVGCNLLSDDQLCTQEI